MAHSSDAFSVADALAEAFVETPAIARIYVALSVSLARVGGIVIGTGSHGFITHEMRGYRGDVWCYSLVRNQRWIRLYVREPELARRTITSEQFLSEFSNAEVTAKGEIAINIADELLARRVCLWLEGQK